MAEAPEEPRPRKIRCTSFLRDLKAHIAPSRLWQIYWCRYHEWLLIIGGMISRRCASPFAAAVGVSEELGSKMRARTIKVHLLVQVLAPNSSAGSSYWGEIFIVGV